MNKFHSTLPKPTKEPGYRFLHKGEVIREDDEAWDSFERKWAPVKVTMDLDVDELSVGCFRRAIQ